MTPWQWKCTSCSHSHQPWMTLKIYCTTRTSSRETHTSCVWLYKGQNSGLYRHAEICGKIIMGTRGCCGTETQGPPKSPLMFFSVWLMDSWVLALFQICISSHTFFWIHDTFSINWESLKDVGWCLVCKFYLQAREKVTNRWKIFPSW
jgi:hypothetical protein